MGWFGRKKEDNNEDEAKKKLPALPEDPSLTPPVSAKYGNYCASRAYMNPDLSALGIEQLKAYQLPGDSYNEGGWRLVKIRINDNRKFPEKSPTAKIHEQEIKGDNLTFWQVVVAMARFEGTNFDMVPVGPSIEEMGDEHFRAFAIREKTVAFDAFDMPHVAIDGKVPSGGTFMQEDLEEVMRSFEREEAPVKTSAWDSGVLAGVFETASGQSSNNFENVIWNLKQQGHVEDYVAALVDAKNTLGMFDQYFDDKIRSQTIAEWYDEARTDAFMGMVPEKFKEYNLSVQDILSSKTLKKMGDQDPEKYRPFINALEQSVTKRTETIESRFRQALDRAHESVRAIERLNEKCDPDGDQSKTLDTWKLKEAARGLEFSFLYLSAKAQFELMYEVNGNREALSSDLEETCRECAEVMEEIYGGNDAVDVDFYGFITEHIVMRKPHVFPPFVEETIKEYSDCAKRYGTAAKVDTSGEMMHQVELPLEGGQNGMTKHKVDVSVGELLEKIKKEKGEDLAKQWEEQIQQLKSDQRQDLAYKKALNLPKLPPVSPR